MASGGNNFNYFSQDQLTKFSACSLANKGVKTDLKVEVQIICERSEQKNFLNCCISRIVVLTLKISNISGVFNPLPPTLKYGLAEQIRHRIT